MNLVALGRAVFCREEANVPPATADTKATAASYPPLTLTKDAAYVLAEVDENHANGPFSDPEVLSVWDEGRLRRIAHKRKIKTGELGTPDKKDGRV
jgi:hypothetical protein